MTIALVDTSVLCELLRVPMCHSQAKHFTQEFKMRREQDHTFFLPVATVLETGNHIGQHGDGREKREAATRFTKLVRDAVKGVAPFVPSRFIEPEQLVDLLERRFPEWAMRGSGLGDLTIVEEWEIVRSRTSKRRVYVWSRDEHLQSYDTGEP